MCIRDRNITTYNLNIYRLTTNNEVATQVKINFNSTETIKMYALTTEKSFYHKFIIFKLKI